MELIEVERQSPIGYYQLTFRCSSCRAQLNSGFDNAGIFGHSRRSLDVWFKSKYCLLCGHKWNQDKILEGFDICDLFNIPKDQVNDETLISCLKKYKYLPDDFSAKPEWDKIHHGDSTGGFVSEHWFVTGIDRRNLDRGFAIL